MYGLALLISIVLYLAQFGVSVGQHISNLFNTSDGFMIHLTPLPVHEITAQLYVFLYYSLFPHPE